MYQNKYPFIFIHGMMGWGEEEKMYNVIPYWGMVCGNLCRQLRDSGIEAYAPQVSPVGSAWARACELYAQLTGTRVDYGAAHAAKFHHERYGRTYDKALVPGWGTPMEDGGIKKIHLLGHSFGGATIRTLSSLLAYGSEEERAVTPESDLSPLFAGGHGNWVQTVTSVSAPHDGTTLIHKYPKLMVFIKAVVFGLPTLVANLGGGKVYDVHMEQYGLNEDPFHRTGRRHLLFTPKQLKGFYNILKYRDNVMDNLRVDDAAILNKDLTPNQDVYYFSVTGCGTKPDPKHPENQIGDKIMIFAFYPFARGMGKFPEGYIGGNYVNKNWRPNDGLVPVESGRFPQKEPHINLEDAKTIEKGIWHVLPDYVADHGTVIGGSVSYIGPGRSKPYKDYWRNHIQKMMELEE